MVFNESAGTYYQLCLLESVSYLKEGNYIEFGNYAVRVTGQCSYLDVNRERQTVTIALIIQNTAEKTTWTPKITEIQSTLYPDWALQEIYERLQTVGKPGDVIGVSFGPAGTRIRSQYLGGQHHADLLGEIYTLEQLQEYIKSGDPSLLENLLVPVYVSRSADLSDSP